MDPISLAILGLGALGTITSAATNAAAIKEQKRAAEEEMKLAREQFDAQQEELMRQQEKEAYTQESNANALGDVFQDKKKQKKQDEVFLSDVEGLY